MQFGDNVSKFEFIPPFYKEFAIKWILVDSIIPHANPVDLVLNRHVQDCWKLGRMSLHLESRAKIP